MLDFGPTFIWVIVNLLVLYFFLKRILFKPVTKFMEDRTNAIKNELASAEKDRTEATQLLQEYETQLKDARQEADKIIGEARAQAEKEHDAIVSEAKRISEELLDKSRLQIKIEREQMQKEMMNQMVGLALSAASKVIEANMDNEANRKLVKNFIDEAGAA